MGLTDLFNAGALLNLSDDQKKALKTAVKEAKGNKDMIISALSKAGINVSEAQLNMVIAAVEKL